MNGAKMVADAINAEAARTIQWVLGSQCNDIPLTRGEATKQVAEYRNLVEKCRRGCWLYFLEIVSSAPLLKAKQFTIFATCGTPAFLRRQLEVCFPDNGSCNCRQCRCSYVRKEKYPNLKGYTGLIKIMLGDKTLGVILI